MAALQSGRQLLIQTPFAKSDQRFNGIETIYAGSVTHDRSGNERVLDVSKRCGSVKRGFRQGMSAVRFNYVWRT